MRPFVDLHLHTRCSDGEHTVPELLSMLEQANVGIFSITDHDTVDAYLQHSLSCIRGVEISARHAEQNVHILGYGFDEQAPSLAELLAGIRMRRAARMRLMLEYIKQQHGIAFAQEDVEAILSRQGTIGKPLVMELLHRYGYGHNADALEKRYIRGFRSPISYRVSAEEAVDAIHSAGGLAVLAHPKEYETKYGIDVQAMLPSLCERGLDGLEVYHSTHTHADTVRYGALAEKHHLLISGGSDFHGLFMKPDVKPGRVTREGDSVTDLPILQAL